ncbi:MAG: glycosyltransferase family 2 protein [Solirubrobacterales bacterium]
MSSLSVIIPAFNAAPIIDATLSCVAGQTNAPDEVIVVDDGSTDDTCEVAQRWSSLLPLKIVRLAENVGGGVGAGGARIAGIDGSSGDLIALLDADDHWFPDHLAVMRREYELHGGLITANALLWRPSRYLDMLPTSDLVPVPPPDEQWLAILSENFVFVATLFDRALYDAAGGFRNIRCEDWDLWIRMIETGARVHIPDQVTALYRKDASSVSGQDKLLVGDIDLLTELAASHSGEELAVIEQALRRRRARQFYLDGLASARRGDIAAARRLWWRSITADPSFRRNNAKLNGRVVFRSAACIAAPVRMTRLRDRRQTQPSPTGSAARGGRE